jgi:hypothetical protein
VTVRWLAILSAFAAGLALLGTVALFFEARSQDRALEAVTVSTAKNLAGAAAERREQIILAGERAVALLCRDVNLQRREQRLTILEGRSRLRALVADGSISQGLFRVAIEQGDRRLARLAPINCAARAAVFRHTALNGL